MRKPLRQSGFTIIELLVVLIVIGILATLVITTYSGVQAKNRNSDRQATITSIQAELETYYAQYNMYPTLGDINSEKWQKANLKDIPAGTLKDPSWSKDDASCTEGQKPVFSNEPKQNCLSYQVTTSEGAVCDNKGAVCAQYTLTAQLEGGGKYVKSSLN